MVITIYTLNIMNIFDDTVIFLLICHWTQNNKKKPDGDSLYCTVVGWVDLVHMIGYYNNCVKFECNILSLYTKNDSVWSLFVNREQYNILFKL